MQIFGSLWWFLARRIPCDFFAVNQRRGGKDRGIIMVSYGGFIEFLGPKEF